MLIQATCALAVEEGLPTISNATMGQVLFVADDIYSTSFQKELPTKIKVRPEVAERRFAKAHELCQQGKVAEALQWGDIDFAGGSQS